MLSSCGFPGGNAREAQLSQEAELRIAAAWLATEELDPDTAANELAAAIELSPSTATNERGALEARILAIRRFNSAELSAASGDYEAALMLLQMLQADAFVAPLAAQRANQIEQKFFESYVHRVQALLAEGLAQEAFETLEEIAELVITRETNPDVSQLRADLDQQAVPLLRRKLSEILDGENPESARPQVDRVVALLGEKGAETQALVAQLEASIETAEQRRVQRVAAEAAAAKAERDRVISRINCVRDAAERLSRCHDSQTYSRNPSNRLYFYVLERDGQRPALMMTLQTRGNRWLFWEWARVYVGPNTYDIDPSYWDIRRANNASSTWETFTRQATTTDMLMMLEIIQSRQATIRFVDDNGRYREHKLSNAQINAITNVAAYWDLSF